MTLFKGAQCSLGEKFKNSIKELFSEENKVAGSATCKQSQTAFNCVVLSGHENKLCLFSLFGLK